jgi:CheY-like chemotaxis protein
MDGYEASRKIKEGEKGEATPIIALTASAFKEEREKILSTGCDDFIRKPFHDYEIFEMMEKYLGTEFIYEEETHGEEIPVQLTSESFNSLPEELVKRLKEAAEELNVDKTKDIIEEVAKTDKSLAKQMFALLEDFRFDVLQELFEE